MIGIIIFTLTAFTMAIFISLISIKYKIETKTEEFEKYLPGYNCGGCGYATCNKMAEAMNDDFNNYKKCRPLRGDKLLEMEAYLKKSKLL